MIESLVDGFLKTVPSFTIVILCVGALWHILNKITPFDDEKELFENRNWAYLLQRLGLCSAQVIAMLAVVPDFNPTYPLWSSFWLALEGLYVMGAVLLSKYAVDWVIFPKVKNTDLLLEKNLAVGIVEAAFYVGLGFILKGSLTGSANFDGALLSSNWLSFTSSIVFFALGLAFVIGVFWLHELTTRYNLREALKKGNTTAALDAGGLLLATSIVVSVGVAGDFSGWREGFVAFFVTSVLAVSLLYLMRWMIDKLILRNTTVAQIHAYSETVAAGLLSGLVILMGLLTATVVAYVI